MHEGDERHSGRGIESQRGSDGGGTNVCKRAYKHASTRKHVQKGSMRRESGPTLYACIYSYMHIYIHTYVQSYNHRRLIARNTGLAKTARRGASEETG